jgi:large subunit ribosomal protein L22
MADVKAQLNKLRVSPRKVRIVTDLIKGKDVVKALHQLEFTIRGISPHLIKLINSAVANAENNFNMVKENLYIKDILVDEGIKLRRYRPKGFGRAALIQKKTSHIKILLGERVAGMKAKTKKKEKEKVENTVREEKTFQDKRPEIKTELGQKSNILGKIGKKMFQRKSI